MRAQWRSMAAQSAGLMRFSAAATSDSRFHITRACFTTCGAVRPAATAALIAASERSSRDSAQIMTCGATPSPRRPSRM